MHDSEQLISKNGKIIYETLLNLKSKGLIDKMEFRFMMKIYYKKF